MKQFNTILQLRRDNDYNYAKVKNSFIPLNGEICLVDTARSGLRAICGDGVTPFGELEYVDSIFTRGYYNNGAFYEDIELTKTIQASTNLLYIDKNSSTIYYFDGEAYQITGINLPTATSTAPGVMKLYTTIGYNEDGTMTQKAITEELEEKFEIELDVDQELIIFIND